MQCEIKVFAAPESKKFILFFIIVALYAAREISTYCVQTSPRYCPKIHLN